MYITVYIIRDVYIIFMGSQAIHLALIDKRKPAPSLPHYLSIHNDFVRLIGRAAKQ